MIDHTKDSWEFPCAVLPTDKFTIEMDTANAPAGLITVYFWRDSKIAGTVFLLPDAAQDVAQALTFAANMTKKRLETDD